MDQSHTNLKNEFLSTFKRNLAQNNKLVVTGADGDIEKLANGFRDVKMGDRIRFDYCPQNGGIKCCFDTYQTDYTT